MSAQRRIGGGLSIWRNRSRMSLRSAGLHALFATSSMRERSSMGSAAIEATKQGTSSMRRTTSMTPATAGAVPRRLGPPDAPLRLMMTKVIYGVVGNRKGRIINTLLIDDQSWRLCGRDRSAVRRFARDPRAFDQRRQLGPGHVRVHLVPCP